MILILVFNPSCDESSNKSSLRIRDSTFPGIAESVDLEVKSFLLRSIGLSVI